MEQYVVFQDKEEEHVACACVGTGASFLIANKQYHDFSYDLYIYYIILYDCYVNFYMCLYLTNFN